MLGFFCRWLGSWGECLRKFTLLPVEKRLTDLPGIIDAYLLGKENGNNGMIRS